jgi:recombinational DNA repair ATPase RecF
MASSKRDFERFVISLHRPENQTPSDVRRLANLVLAHFDELAQTSRQRNQRSIYLVPHARNSLAQTHDGPPNVEAVAADGAWAWRRLRHLTLGPFRGFRTVEPFDLQKRVILFYGPNGSGKTSLCEGLEYALLGTVEEADTKRIDARTYLANVHENRFETPVLQATDHRNREVPVTASLDTYRFCFIEKNRIDAFSRIAARPASQRTELIATLFGMEKFNEFVSHFNESIDQQLLLTAAKQLALTSLRNTLSADQTTVNGEAETLLTLENEEAALALEYSEGLTYEGLKALIGSVEAPGRLQELGGVVNAVPPAAIGLTRQGLLDGFEAARRSHEEHGGIIAKLQARSSQVSFKDLYSAVLALQETEGDHCPACDTPLGGDLHVVVNPYTKAAEGLAELRELGELQQERDTVQDQVATTSRELRQQIATLIAFVVLQEEQETAVGRYLAELATDPAEDWWKIVYQPERQAQEHSAAVQDVTLDQILAVSDRVAEQDAASLLARQERQRNIAERDRLNEFRLFVQAQDLKRQQFIDDLSAARRRIDAFNTANAELINEVAQETLDISRDTPIKAAYDRFLAMLKDYRNRLPGALMAGLNDTVMTLYNEFNRNDLDQDKLAALYLPVTGEEKIEVSFRGNPQVRMDALRILSEGHIRCLGLAILLAKSQSLQCPLIVFDDAINAIDHDHRAGIRETIFESNRFAQTQLIVTCHSNEFIKDIQQHLPAQLRNDCQVYLLRNHDGNYQPRVTGNVTSRNYVEKARSARNDLNDREALASSRQALEMLSEKTWRWLDSHDLGLLSLKLDYNSEPGLRNLCDALMKRLNSATTFTHNNKPVLAGAFSRILGIPATNLVWLYLNKGTHEEANRDDFDGELVESVVQTLEALDRLDLRPER